MQRRFLWLVPVATVIAMLGRAYAADPPAAPSTTPAATAPAATPPATAAPTTGPTPAADTGEPATTAPATPATPGKSSSGRFEPTEKIRADFDVSFPVDI